MYSELTLQGFHPVGIDEAAIVLGGVDKRAQDALYTIGYIFGFIARLFTSLFSFLKPTV